MKPMPQRNEARIHGGKVVAQKPLRLKPIHPNKGLEVDYRRRLLRLVDALHLSIDRWLEKDYKALWPKIDQAQDASPGADLTRAVRVLRRRWETQFGVAAQQMADWFAQETKDYTDGRLMKILKDAGIAIEFSVPSELQTALTAMVEENVSLIKSIASENLTQVESLVMRSVRYGRDLQTLKDELQKRYGITRRRAILIARDQNNKATGNILKLRQQQFGITKAIWRHSTAGKHPRPEHVAADGKEYDVEKGMYLEGKWTWPGYEINCRCVSIPVIPGLD